MIDVRIDKCDEKRELSLRIKGHAGQADIGKDIVCASASILAYTVAQVIKTMEQHGDLEKKPVIKMKNGDALISCKPKTDKLYAEALHTYFVAQVGYSLLSYNYPEYVNLTMFGKAIKP